MEIVPLDSNESYWLLDEETLALIRDLPASALGTYPSYDGLTADLANYANVPVGSLSPTPGSDEAIRATVRFCAKHNYRALLVLPTFSGYERVLMETPLDTTRFYYEERDGRFEFPLQRTLDHISQHRVDVVFLCEPNNPLGSVLDPAAFASIMAAAKVANALVVNDEAYGEFGGTSALPYLGQQPVIVLRTLSKAFGVPGIRVGYACSSSEIVAELRAQLFGTLPWIIPGPSVHAARVVLSRAKVLQARKETLIAARGALSSGLATFPGMEVFPSSANFVLARHERAGAIAAGLLQAGLRVGEGERKTWDDAAKVLLRSTLRIAIPSPTDQERLFSELHAILDKSPSIVA